MKKDLDREMGRGCGHPMFSDFGGMGKVLEELTYRVLIPLRYLELQNRLKKMNAALPTGILLHGPPGCGKTKLAQAIANESGLSFYEIAAPQIVSGVTGQSEVNIRELFSKAHKTSPSIIFIDEIDAISEKRENSQKGMEGRIVTQLLKCMDNIQGCASATSLEGSVTASQPPENLNSKRRPAHILVIGATNRVNSLDRALRRPGRFSWEIELHTPDENARFEILSLLTRDLVVHGSLDLRKLSRDTNGFVGADLEECVSKACLLAMQKLVDSKRYEVVKETTHVHHFDDWWKRLNFTHEKLEALVPTIADFELKVSNPL